MKKLSDYVMDFLANRGVDTVFTVSGGGIMHLLDSLGTHPRLRYYCNYHEQACTICAEGYAKIRSHPGACLVTVGPGAVNAISGLVGAWFDGVPMIVIAGQVRRDIIADYSVVRQFGPQEANVVGMASTVTKYAATVTDPADVRFHLEKAWHLATTGRPGPVLLDIPLDVQGSQIDETALRAFDPASVPPAWDPSTLQASVDQVVALLAQARRPVLTGGTGVPMAHARDLFQRLAERLQIPVIVPFCAKELFPEDHPLYMGVFGTAGQRRANFTVQNADLLLSCATGLSITKVGFNFKGFAPRARKIVVDIDPGQLLGQAVKPDLPVQADVRTFLEALLAATEGKTFTWSPKWLPACRTWREKYPVIVDDFRKDPDYVNSYVFTDELANALTAEDVLVTGNGLDVVSYYQAFKAKAGQRVFTSNNWGSMGWGLPLAIGACLASGRRRTICFTGDGSLLWNIQELLFIQHHRLPVIVFVLNNDGYTSIRVTQDNFFSGRYAGADSRSGVANPDFVKLADTFGLAYSRIGNPGEVVAGIARALASDGPALCEVMLNPAQGISPKASAFKRADGTLESRPLEDMAPFLPREEIHAAMHQFDDE